MLIWKWIHCTVKPRFMDTHLIQTPHYYTQFALSLGKESPYIFSKFNPINTDTPLIQTLSMAPPVSILTGFDCTLIIVCLTLRTLHLN